MEKLLEEGARDVFFTPIYMKKNRPANKLSIICLEEDVETMESIVFKNTTSIGIRKQKMERSTLDREIISLDTEYGPVNFKVSCYENEKNYIPEYEDITEICNRTGLGYNKIYGKILGYIDKF